jgi:cobalt-zinc-cadmium efflux system outer membrane protein
VSRRFRLGVLLTTLLAGGSIPARAQVSPGAITSRFIDPVGGLSLEQAVARALENEPALRSTRSDIDVAKGARLQAALRPNPSVSFERRDEPGGTDSLTTVSVTWPLDLFRRTGRVAVADLEVAGARLAVSDRERLLVAEVRTQYGEVLASVREVAVFDEGVVAMQRQHGLLCARVAEGASPPLDRDVVDVELRRLQSDQLIRVGRAEAAMMKLKRLLGMRPDASLTLRDTLETVVNRESATTQSAAAASQHLDARADVRQAAIRVDLAEARINHAEREGRFDVSLYGSYMRVRGQFSYLSVGTTVTLPLFNRNQGDVASAKAERASAAAARDASRSSAETEAAAAALQYERARQAVTLYADGTGARNLAKHNLTVVRQSYELGRVTVFDVLAEQRRYLEIEHAYTEVLRATYEAATALKLALGETR